MKRYILAIDEGTTSERVALFDTSINKIIDSHSLKITQYYPKESWVEQDANEIWNNVKSSLETIIKKHKLTQDDVIGIGITNQRETTVAWNKASGLAVTKAIVWQCKRTESYCSGLPAKTKELIKQKTGLVVDSYFSATKMRWLLSNDKDVKKSAKDGTLALGTMDSFLVYKLTGGKTFATDTTNASRTMLVDISSPFNYDEDLLKIFDINKSFLPEIKNSADNYGLAKTIIGDIPILSVIGDQQSSLIGQGCIETGKAKITYGTGGFLLVNSGLNLLKNNNLTLNTVAYSISGTTTYAIEGSIFNVGSTLEYLKNTLNLFDSYANLDNICKQAVSDQVYFLPAFSGLGAPYWSGSVKAGIYGLTLGTEKADIVKSAIESFALIVADISRYLSSLGIKIKHISADGGVSKCNYLLEFQSAILGCNVVRMAESESTSLGAIFLAGLQAGTYHKLNEISRMAIPATTFSPKATKLKASKRLAEWDKFVMSTLSNN